MKALQNRVEQLEKQEPEKKIDIPIHRWVEKDRTELEEQTGIKFIWANEVEQTN